MKKKLLLLTALALAIGNAMADEIVTDNMTIPQGGTAVMNVELNSTESEYMGFEFKLALPEEIVAVEGSAKLGERFNGMDHSLGMSRLTNGENAGKYQFVCLSFTAKAIPDTKGVLLSVTLSADESLEVGETVQATLSGIEFSTTESQKVVFDDLVFTITIGEPDDGRIKFDENATSLPSYTAGEKDNVSMRRTVKAGQWSTIVLPFTLTKAKAEAAFGSDVQLAEFSGFEVDYGEDEENVIPLGIKINMTTYTMTSKKGMTGGKPFLIKTSQDIESFEADDVTLFDAVTDVAKADDYDTPGKLTGTLVKTTIPTDGLFLNGNQFWYSTGKSTAKAFRCWFELGAVLDKETDFSSRIFLHFDDSETTGICLTPSPSLRGEGSMYTLDGRQIQRSTLRKGVYVRNGKKMIVK